VSTDLKWRNQTGLAFPKKLKSAYRFFSKFEFWPVEHFGRQERVLDLGSVARCERGVGYPFLAVGVERTHIFGVPSV